jgi:hypothetical protein
MRVDISTETLQAFLDDAWDAAPEEGDTLRDTLRGFEKQLTAQFETAGSLGSVSKNSASQSYRGPGLGSYTIPQIQTAWRTLINLFDSTLAWINSYLANPPATPPTCWTPPEDNSDATVYQFMKNQLVVVTEYQPDLSNLRLRPTLGYAPQTW